MCICNTFTSKFSFRQTQWFNCHILPTQHCLFRQQRLACGTICNLGLWEALHCPMKRKGERHANEHQQLQEPWLLEKVRWISRISHIFDLVRKLVGDASKSDHRQEWQNEGSFVHHVATQQHSNRSALVRPRSMCRRDPKGPFWASLLDAEPWLHMVTYGCKFRLEVWYGLVFQAVPGIFRKTGRWHEHHIRNTTRIYSLYSETKAKTCSVASCLEPNRWIAPSAKSAMSWLQKQAAAPPTDYSWQLQ